MVAGTNDVVVGKTYYTRDGGMVELVALTTDGKYVCVELNELDIYPDGRETVWGSTVILDSIYIAAPRAKVDAEIAALRAEGERLSKLNNELRSRVLDAERDNTKRLAHLAKFNGLELLESFIDGKVTHVVVEDYSGAKVLPFADLNQLSDYYRKPEGIKLICLFGNTGGRLDWRVNEYKDGSGSSWKRLAPAMSQEEAESIIRQWAADDLKSAETDAASGRLYSTVAAVKRAIALGIEVPPAQSAIYESETTKGRNARIAELTKKATEIQTELARLEAEVA